MGDTGRGGTCVYCGAALPAVRPLARTVEFEHEGLPFRVSACLECDACARERAVERYGEHRELVRAGADGGVAVDWDLYCREREAWRGETEEFDRLLKDVGVLRPRGAGAYDVVGCGVSLCPGWWLAFSTKEHARGYAASVYAGATYRVDVVAICG